MTFRKRASALIIAGLLAGAPALASVALPTGDGAVLNPGNQLPGGYSLSYDHDDQWGEDYSVFRMSLADGFGVVNSSMAASDDPRLRPLTRLDTSFTFSTPLIHAPTRVGDTVSSSSFWDQPVRIGGLQIGTIAPVMPDIVAPSMLFAPDVLNAPGAANMASTRFIDHVNTVAQLQRQDLAPSGQGSYSFEMGRIREDFELRSNNYGSWLASGTYRYGITHGTTVDGQFAQLGAQQSVLGVGIMQGLGALGQASARVANSHDTEGFGWLARMGYDFDRNNVSLALRTRIQSTNYQPINDIAAVEPLRQRTLASAGWSMGSLGKVSVASATQTFADDTRRDVLALSHAVPIAGGGVLSTAAAYSPGQVAGSAVLVSVYYPFNYWAPAARTLTKQLDISLDKTIDGALSNLRAPISGRLVPGLLLQ